MFNCIQRNKSCRVEREMSRRHCYLLKSLSRLRHRLCKQEVITQAFHLGIPSKHPLAAVVSCSPHFMEHWGCLGQGRWYPLWSGGWLLLEELGWIPRSQEDCRAGLGPPLSSCLGGDLRVVSSWQEDELYIFPRLCITAASVTGETILTIEHQPVPFRVGTSF